MSKKIRILRRPQVRDRTGLSTSTIYEKMAKKQFPSAIKLGTGQAVGWIESEIDEYLQQCVIASRGGL